MGDPNGQDGKKLLVAIPCLNEAASIVAVIKRIPLTIAGIERIDVLVVDDGSTDRTAELAMTTGGHVLRHPRNYGVGRAFRSAVDYAVENGYDVMVNMDGDGQFNPVDSEKLVEPVLAGTCDMTTASRFIDPMLVPDMPKVKLVGNQMMSWLISQLVRHRYYDVSCGFRCYSREALLQTNLQGKFTYTQETFLHFAAQHLSILEIPVRVEYFADRKSRVASSIIKYAYNSASIIFRGYRDYFPLRFFWAIAIALFLTGAVLGTVFLLHYLATGYFSGQLYLGFTAAFFAGTGLAFFILGIIADMLVRVRTNQERILYQLKKRHGK